MALKEKLSCFLLYFLLCFLPVPASNQIIQICWTFIIAGLPPFVISLSCLAVLDTVFPKHFPHCGIRVVCGCSIAELRSWRRKRSDKKKFKTLLHFLGQTASPDYACARQRWAWQPESFSINPGTATPWSYRGVFASCMQTWVSPDFPGIHLIFWNKTLPPCCLQIISKEV